MKVFLLTATFVPLRQLSLVCIKSLSHIDSWLFFSPALETMANKRPRPAFIFFVEKPKQILRFIEKVETLQQWVIGEQTFVSVKGMAVKNL